jgi:hypothetical protein
VRYRHPELRFELELTDGALVRDDIPGMALVAIERETDPSSGFRANLVVTVEEVAAGTTVEAYTSSSLRVQDDLLSGHRLIDVEATAVSGAPATRTLGHHAQDRLAVTIEQWRLVAGVRAYTVTASCATLDYAAVADGFREAAESLVAT